MQNKHSEKLKKDLKLLDMPLKGGALYFVTDIESSDFLQQHPAEYFALEQAQKLKATAVYFKKFANRPSLPQIYIYDYTNKNYQESEFGEIHKHIWNSGVVPLVYVFTKTAIKIIDCSKQPAQKGLHIETNEYLDDISIEDILSSASETQEKLKRYSAKLFDNGSFWDKPENKDKFNFKQFAYEKLKDALVRLKNSFIKKAEEIGLTDEIAKRLFLQSILIKYLEERKDGLDNHVFPENYFKEYENASDFCEVLKKGMALNLFDNLHQHKFNGEIFYWADQTERNQIQQANLSELATFLYANDTNKQSEIWRLYSFEYIPIEFISSIYDEFIGDNKKGVVYTPLHLAKFLVDEAMPITEYADKENFRVIDPACGSGIFLVLAYKRLVEWWRIRHQKKPDVQTLKQILTDNIAGVDISEEATQLSIFSLSLALCDLLSPTEIWFELKFDNLKQKNIQCADFFEWLKQNPENKFDLVIGNPPFKRKLESKAYQIEQERLENNHTPIPRKQLALLFLEKTTSVLKNNALLCLIMPASFIYNKSSESYKKYLFSKYNIIQILDFIALKSFLFDGRTKEPVIAIFLENKTPDEEDMLHLVLKNTKTSKERIYFEIDEYDFHFFDKKIAITDTIIWKINLLGGGRLYNLINRLRNLYSFGYFLNKKKKEGWFFCEGYKLGHDGTKDEDYLIKNKFKTADYITGKEYLPIDNFDDDGIKEIEINNNIYFERPRKKYIYEAPHILIKEMVINSVIPISFVDYYLTFSDRIFGIHAPEKDCLIKIKDVFSKNNLNYVFYLFCNDSVGINRSKSTLSQHHIMGLPYPDDERQLNFSTSEEIIRNDVLNYLASFALGENSEIMNLVNEPQLKNFVSIFCDVLNSVYEENNQCFQLTQLIQTNSFLCCKLSYQENKSIDVSIEKSPELEKTIEELIYNAVGEAVIYNRIIRVYKNNSIYLIKPNLLRYWLGSIALWDADKTIADLIAGGY
jgi:hypothetical protein